MGYAKYATLDELCLTCLATQVALRYVIMDVVHYLRILPTYLGYT